MAVNYAHRGASGYCPENTMMAFERAIELGAEGIETDVQMTKDGQLVLIHDETLNRTTSGSGFVKDHTLEELKALDAGVWLGQEFAGIKIPTLEELLVLAKKTNILLNLEIKTGIVLYPGIEEKIINSVIAFGLKQKCILSSFNHYSMTACKEIDPQIKTGLLYTEGLFQPWEYCKMTGADAIHPYFRTIDSQIVKSTVNSGVEINVYTVNDEKDMNRMIEFGVHGIITNYPDRLNKIGNRY